MTRYEKVGWGAIVAVFVALMFAVWHSSATKIRDGDPYPNRRSRVNDLRQIATAIHIYHDANRKLLPASITDKDGQPLLSWRVQLLPYLEGLELYKQFHLDEPWDSPHNIQLLEKMPQYYASDEQDLDDHTTHLQVFVGPGTAFERPGLRWRDFPFGYNSRSVLVIEGAKPVPWTKPEDLEYDPAKPLPPVGVTQRRKNWLGFRSAQRPENVLYVTVAREVESIPYPPSEQVLRKLLDRNLAEAPGAEKN